MAKTITLTIEHAHVNLTVQQLQTLQALAAAKTSIFTDLDSAEAFLQAELPGWFIYRGGSHVAVHAKTAEGGINDRILMVEEREVARYRPTVNFGALTTAVKAARAQAQADAREAGRTAWKDSRGKAHVAKFVRSRGTKVYTLNAQGRTAPHADEPDDFDGTKRQLVALVADIVANHPQCDEVQLAGGFDVSETFDFDDYEPEVTSWDVMVWTRSEGWAF